MSAGDLEAYIPKKYRELIADIAKQSNNVVVSMVVKHSRFTGRDYLQVHIPNCADKVFDEIFQHKDLGPYDIVILVRGF